MNILELPDDDPVGALRDTVSKARFEPIESGPDEINIIFQAKEVTFPITHHFLDRMVAEHVATSLKTVIEEIFDSLETQALEIAGSIPVEFSTTWKNGPDAVSQMWLKYATDEKWKECLGATEHPPQEEAFGSTPFFVYLTAVIIAAKGVYYVSYASWVRPATQDPDNKLSYTSLSSLETIH